MNSYSKLCIAAAVAVIISLPAHGQKKQFTMAEATVGMSGALAPKAIKNASWQPGTDKLWLKNDDADEWKVISFANGSKNVTTAKPGELPAKVTGLPAIKWLDRQTAWFMNGKNIVTGTLSAGKFTWSTFAALPENAANITIDKSRKVAYTIDNNLWLWDKQNGSVQVSAEADKNIVCGQAVHRDEFGIDRGIFFSPRGTSLAYYRMDQTMVKDYPIIKWGEVPATADIIKYPMAGGPSHEVTLCVYNPATRKTVTLKTGDKNKDHYLTAVTWSPDEQYIYIALLNREQNHLWLNKYNARTGDKVSTLFEETNKKYVHPAHALTFLPWNSNEFIWWSERDGYDHLYLYNTRGTLLRQITKGSWVVNEITGFNERSHEVIITAAKESPLEKHIYTAGVADGTLRRIDMGAGMHTAVCSDDGHYVLDVYSGEGTPRNTMVRATEGNYNYQVLKAADPLESYERPEIKNVTVKAADGKTDLYGKLILPTNFDKNKKYPVIVYLYNGPNVQLIHNSFPESGNLWYEYMAQHGYIVFTIDGRGSWNRGARFEQATFRNLGEVEMKDQLKGVDYLKSLPYVDANRMGVHGWSYGGFMTTSLMLKYPGVFKCGVAGGPVMDWRMYEVMNTERYMDTPEENPDGYKSAGLLDKVKNLKGKLMLIHGTDDNVVVWQHSINFIKKSVDEGVQVDYFVYPGYEHNVRGKDRTHLMQKISDYFDLYLKP